MDGILVIDKPVGPTSHDVVQIVKRLTGASKVGHLGTLDPAATGVLPVVLNGATKYAASLAGIKKIYEFQLNLGVVTNTDDDTGQIIKKSPVDISVLQKLEDLLPKFIGLIMQKPPAFSAVKKSGRRSYEFARKGVIKDLDLRPVQIDKLCITMSCMPNVKMRLECNSGTYVRSLCRDLGEELGCGGHASGIRRLRSGDFSIEMAIKLDDMKKNPELWKKALKPVHAQPGRSS